MNWFKKKNLNTHSKELSRERSSTYYYNHRDEILKKRHERYRETGF